MPAILGLTGNIASGKTTVGLMLLELGTQTYVDADHVAHELYLPGQPLVAQLAGAFGPSILDAEGGVDRRALGRLVFGDSEQLRRLEAITHPAIRAALIARLRALPASGVAVLDAVKLIESGYAPLCAGVWLVIAPESVQLERLVTTRGLSEGEARQRLAAQPAPAAKRSQATDIIENTGSLDDLRAQVSAAWDRFRASLGDNG